MIINGFDLDQACNGVSFDMGVLRFACAAEEANAMALVLVPPTDPDYLAAMEWAISTGKLAP